MSNEFSADEGANGKRMQCSRPDFDSEIEPRYFDEWLTERYGKSTILKETIGDDIVTLSFTGIGRTLKITDPPAFWEVAEYNKRRRRVMVYAYASEEEASVSFFASVERSRSERR